MKRLASCSVMAVLTLCVAAPAALAAGSSASGGVAVTLGDKVTREIKFHAENVDDRTTKGEMVFTDPAATPGFDPEDPDRSKDQVRGLEIGVAFDCLVVRDNQAVMSGVVVRSDFADAVGERVLLTVEDNALSREREPDRVGWGIYGNHKRDWTPADAELKEDRGWSLTWIATDAERKDDVGVKIDRDPVIGCDSFPLASYALVDVQPRDGDIQVTP